MISYLLDTSIIIDYLRDNKEAVNLLDNLDGTFYSSSVCLAEIYEGVNRVRDSQELESQVENFFHSLSGILPFDTKEAKSFGAIRAYLKESGEVIEDLDIQIGATCLVNDLVLITKNKKHFSRIKHLPLYTF